MGRSRTCLLLVLALGVPPGVDAQQPQDAQVAKGIQQVESGDMAGAILTLDAASRRLATVSRPRDLSQAYLYLGVAYAAQGQETLAKARWRDALKHAPDVSLDARKYARAAELLEEARKDALAVGTSQGGSKLPRILLGAAAVTGGAVLLSRTGGDEVQVDFARYYGSYPNLALASQTSGCAPLTATLELSGNADGSGFRIDQTSSSGGAPLALTGEIQATGHFTATGGGYSILGQTTSTRIAGSETRQTGGPACTWMFDGTR
jgi:Tfp pilus assembly protein PilF